MAGKESHFCANEFADITPLRSINRGSY